MRKEARRDQPVASPLAIEKTQELTTLNRAVPGIFVCTFAGPANILIAITLIGWGSLLHAEAPWLRHTIDSSSIGADGVRLADVNGDGLLDASVPWEEGGLVRVYAHPERGKEKEPWPAVTVGQVKSPEDAVCVDLDRDGAVDVVSACEGRTQTTFVHWAPHAAKDYFNPGKWTTEAFPATQGKAQWMYGLPLDIDGRNGIDVVLGSKGKNGSVGWLEAPAVARQVAAWKWHRLQDAGWIMSLIAADMDRDGNVDILVSDRKGPRRGIYWLESPGPQRAAHGAQWQRHNVGGSNRETMFITRSDFDQDGAQDIVAVAGRTIAWYRAEQDGWREYTIPLPEDMGTGKSVAVADIDGDGHNDLVLSCENARGQRSGMRWLSWINSPTEGPWESHEIGGAAGIKFDRVVLDDVDGDGDLDVLCCEERTQLGLFWYENPCGAF